MRRGADERLTPVLTENSIRGGVSGESRQADADARVLEPGRPHPGLAVQDAGAAASRDHRAAASSERLAPTAACKAEAHGDGPTDFRLPLLAVSLSAAPGHIRIVRRGSGCDRAIPDGCGAQTAREDRPVLGGPVPDEVSRCLVRRECLGDLARDRLRGRICRYAKRYPKPTGVPYDNETI